MTLPIEIRQAHQYVNLLERNNGLQSLIIEKNSALLAQAEDAKKSDPATATAEANKGSLKEQEPVDRILNTIWKSILIVGLSGLCLVLFIVALRNLLLDRIEKTAILPFKDLRKESALSNENHEIEKLQGDNHNSIEKSGLGEVVADCLVAELHKIRQKYEELDIRDNYISIKPQIPDGEICVDASGLRKQILVGSPSLPHLKLGDSNIIGNIGEVSTGGLIATKISLDSLITLIKGMQLKHKNRIITGSIQKHNDKLRIIARMEQGRRTRAWEVPSNNNENIPDLVKELSYCVARDLSGQHVSTTSFKDLIDLLESYAEFIHGVFEKEFQLYFGDQSKTFDEQNTKLPNQQNNKLNVKYSEFKEEYSKKMLGRLWEKCKRFAEHEPAYEGIFGLFYNIGISLLEKNDYENAEDVFRYVISLEPYIINKLFDIKVAYEDVNWSKEFWINSFREYRSRSDLLSCFAYPLRSRLKSLAVKLSLNKEIKSEYRRISMWANGLSYTLIALGQTLERIKPNESLRGNHSDLEHLIDLSQAKEAYIRADQRDRKDASALAHLSSLMIENVYAFENHDRLKESIIEEAQEKLEQAKSKLENRCLAFNRLGNLCHDQGDYLSAIDCYEKAIIDRHDFIVAYRNLGIARCEIMDFDSSLKSFTEGMNFLPDDAVFQTDFCHNKWHAWLHNGKGWTYLSKYIHLFMKSNEDNTNQKDNTGKKDDGFGLLDLAKYNFHEAISISHGKMYASYFNLGNVYALQNKVEDVADCWKKGLENLKEDKDTTLGKLLSYIYGDTDSHLSKESNTKELKEFIREKHPPIRILNSILQDLLVLKACPDSAQPKYIDIDATIQFMEDYLPTLYVGVSYLWKQQPEKAINIFQRKLPELYLESKGLTYSWFRSYLWILLYCGLIKIFMPKLQDEKWSVTPEVFKNFESCRQYEESVDEAIKRFNNTVQEFNKNYTVNQGDILDELTFEIINQIINDKEFKGLNERIKNALKVFDKIIKKQDSSRELYREILNDMCRKHMILYKGIGRFEKSNVEYRKNLALIFQPVEDSYKFLENQIKHDSKMSNSRFYRFFYQLKNSLFPQNS